MRRDWWMSLSNRLQFIISNTLLLFLVEFTCYSLSVLTRDCNYSLNLVVPVPVHSSVLLLHLCNININTIILYISVIEAIICDFGWINFVQFDKQHHTLLTWLIYLKEKITWLELKQIQKWWGMQRSERQAAGRQKESKGKILYLNWTYFWVFYVCDDGCVGFSWYSVLTYCMSVHVHSHCRPFHPI